MRFNYISSMMQRMNRAVGETAEMTRVLDYLADHVACDFAETVRWWMAHPEHSPEDVCRYILATTQL